MVEGEVPPRSLTQVVAVQLDQIESIQESARAIAPIANEINEHMEHEDATLIFHHACKLGCEGIVSKRKGSPYRSGRSPEWIKMKDPASKAVRREAEEDWGR
jgi:ATP-dependent DNA ligase